MPLSAAAARAPRHQRRIEMDGYAREDGLFDIEGHLTDTRSETLDTVDRHIPPGDVLHGMWIRLTVDEDLVIQACEAASDHTPYAICPQAAANFSRLAGLRIGPGFNRAVHERVGGVMGCTHLREMLAQMATVAYQTTHSVRRRKREAAIAEARAEGRKPPRPPLLNTCLAYGDESPVVARIWPEHALTPAAAAALAGTEPTRPG